jgi:hypothetical protein
MPNQALAFPNAQNFLRHDIPPASLTSAPFLSFEAALHSGCVFLGSLLPIMPM